MRPFLIGSYQNWIKFTINTFQFLRSTLTLSTSVWIQKEKLGSAKPRGRLKSRVNLFSTLDSIHTPVCTQMLFPQKKITQKLLHARVFTRTYSYPVSTQTFPHTSRDTVRQNKNWDDVCLIHFLQVNSMEHISPWKWEGVGRPAEGKMAVQRLWCTHVPHPDGQGEQTCG